MDSGDPPPGFCCDCNAETRQYVHICDIENSDYCIPICSNCGPYIANTKTGKVCVIIKNPHISTEYRELVKKFIDDINKLEK